LDSHSTENSGKPSNSAHLEMGKCFARLDRLPPQKTLSKQQKQPINQCVIVSRTDANPPATLEFKLITTRMI